MIDYEDNEKKCLEAKRKNIENELTILKVFFFNIYCLYSLIKIMFFK